MNTAIKTSLFAFAFAGASQAATLNLVTSNSEVVLGGEVDYTNEILAGQTLYIGVPYAAGAWPSAEATDYFNVSTFLIGVEGASSVSFNFYSASDSGTELNSINPLAGFTAGSAAVPAAGAGTAAELGATSQVNAQVQYADLVGNPFASISNGILWLGITNTGANTVSYYSGVPGFGSPLIAYTFGGPFDTEVSALYMNSYTYDLNGTLPDGGQFQNVHPYVNVSAVTVPEPTAAALGILGGCLLLRRRRVG